MWVCLISSSGMLKYGLFDLVLCIGCMFILILLLCLYWV